MNDDEREIAELLQSAGPRPEPPAAEIEAITAAAHEAWRERYGRRRSSWRWLAAAAAVLIAGVAVWWMAARRDAPLAPVIVARVEHVTGNFAATTIDAGERIATDASTRVALRMDGGPSLRIDGDTEVRIFSATLVELRRGAVYLDTEQRGAIVVRTPAGRVQPVGTRFEVRVDGPRVRVRVREGRVAVNGVRAGAGDELLLDGPSVARGRIRADDPAWEWVTAAIAMPEIEGRSLHDFLEWLTHEKGWQLRYATPEVESRSRATTLHGSVRDLTPEQALQTVLLSAGLRHERNDGVVVWSAEATPPLSNRAH